MADEVKGKADNSADLPDLRLAIRREALFQLYLVKELNNKTNHNHDSYHVHFIY